MSLPKGLTPHQYAKQLGITIQELSRRGGKMSAEAKRLAKAREAARPVLESKPKHKQQLMDFLAKVVNRQRM